MREIRQKPEGREPRTLSRAGRIPKIIMQDIVTKSRAKAEDEMKSAPFGNRQEESSNTPANNAGEQIASSAKDTAKRSADLAYRGGKKLAQAVREKAVYRIKQRTKIVKENAGKIANIRKNPLSEGSSISAQNPSFDKSRPPVSSRKNPSHTSLKRSRQGFSQRNQIGKPSNMRSISDVSERPANLKIRGNPVDRVPELGFPAKITDSSKNLFPRQSAAKDLAEKSIRSKNPESPTPRLNSGTAGSANPTIRRPDAKRQIRSIHEKPKKGIKTAQRTIREPGKKIRTAQKTAQKARQAQKTAARTAKRTRQAARTSVKAARLGVRAVVTAVKAVSAVRTLITAVMAGGWIAVIVILAICVIGLLIGSVYGIFAGDASNTSQGIPVRQAVETLDKEFQDSIENISDTVSHDRRKITSSDGPTSVQWEDVLSVFSAWIAGNASGTPVTTLTDAQLSDLRVLMWEMNEIDYDTHTETHTEKVTEIDEKGNKKTHTETIRETVLTIEITHKSPSEMEKEYSFTDRQKEYLALLTAADTDPLWVQLLGPYSTGVGEIISPDTVWEGTEIFQWPLPESFTITSYFGNREDPFTGEPSYHDGTDIAAPAGTPILAAADGTVETANGTDPWGGGYGYYIKIRHNDSLETLYAHCSAICVSAGQRVEQGEVIGYVGTTGNSTGNHLHFEVRKNGQKRDSLKYFIKNDE